MFPTGWNKSRPNKKFLPCQPYMKIQRCRSKLLLPPVPVASGTKFVKKCLTKTKMRKVPKSPRRVASLVTNSSSVFQLSCPMGVKANVLHDSLGRSEEHTSELQSRGHLVC